MSIERADGAEVSPGEMSDAFFRALREPMDVYRDDPATWGADEVAVYNGGTRYIVNRDVGSCTCPDAQYNRDAGERCKHRWRVALEAGVEPIPEWANREAVDDGLLRARGEADG